MTYIIDRKFKKAAFWCFMASVFSVFGLIHAYDLTPSGIQNHFGWLVAPRFAAAYAITGVVFLILDRIKLSYIEEDPHS